MKPGPFPIRVTAGATDEVTAIAYPALRVDSPASSPPTLLLGHGAGAGQRHAGMVGTAERLRDRGVSVVTFDFPYTEHGRKLPDPNGILEACYRAAFEAVRTMAGGALFAGGRSMGGRIASHVAARRGEGQIAPDGLVLLGYPLRPPTRQGTPGEPGKSGERSNRGPPRDKHLPDVRAPILFVQGTRDVFGTPGDLAPLLPKLARGSEIFAVEGGDHSHAVLKRSGVPQASVLASIADEIVRWMGTCHMVAASP